MIVSPVDVYTQYRDWLLNHSNLTWSQSRKDWTRGIIQFFGNLGSQSGYVPIYTNVQTRVREYLADVVWRVDGPRQQVFVSVESEISGRPLDILYDFRKLLDIKSRYHIGLFKLRTDNRTRLVNQMRGICHSQDLVLSHEDVFVIFMFYTEDNQRIHLSCYELPMNGAYANLVRENDFPFPQ